MRLPTTPENEKLQDRIRIRSVEVLSDEWAVLKKTVFDYRRNDGAWETQIRQTYDRGDGAVILPYDRERGTVLLVKQFRYAAYVTGHAEPLIEACAGLLDDRRSGNLHPPRGGRGARLSPARRAPPLRALYEPGQRHRAAMVLRCRLSSADRISEGGGAADEGEDIEVLEMTLDAALAHVGNGGIVDAKTIMLVQHLALQRAAGNSLSSPRLEAFERADKPGHVVDDDVGAELLGRQLV